MAHLRRFVLRMVALLRFNPAEDELARELASHLALMEDEFRQKGMTAEEARLAAKRAFGGVEQTKEAHRDQRGLPGVESFVRDARYALRTLRRDPSFTTVALLTLALGIGANATVFTLLDATMFQGFPHVDPENRLVYITGPPIGSTQEMLSYPDFQDWQAQAKSFDGLAVVSTGGLRLQLSDHDRSPEARDATRLSANTFQVLGQPPLLGRDFASADEAVGAPPVTILAYDLWAHQFGHDPALIGRAVRIDGIPTTVIGVMPQGFDFPHHRVDLWLPLAPVPALQQRQARSLWFAVGRLRTGVTIARARAEMDAIGGGLATAYPGTNTGIRPVVMNFQQFFIGPDATVMYVALWGAAGCVLLIACANLANLLLARGLNRSREVAVRIALGAGRWPIIRQFLVESVVLSAGAGAFGWVVARWSVSAYESLSTPPSSYDRWTHLVDGRVIAYVVVISAGAGILFGLAPAIRLSRLEVNATLKDGARGVSGSRRSMNVSALLVVSQMALAVVLLAGAGVMVRSFWNVYAANLGVRTGHILTASVRLPAVRYQGAEMQTAFFERLTARLAAVPGVESVALVNGLPGLSVPRRPYELSERPPVDEARRPTVSSLIIGAGYFRTLEVAMRAGREFTDADGVFGAPIVVVNERFARMAWPGEDPLGKHLRLFDSKGATPSAWLTVMGVAPNIVQNDATQQTFEPAVYVPLRQEPVAAMTVIARTHVPPSSLVASFRRAIQVMDSDLVIYSGYGSIDGPKALDESLAFNYWSRGVNGVLFLICAGIALVLASLGLYAVVAYSVSRRTQEIGIRTALGATARDILLMLFRQGLMPVALGLAIGLAVAAAVTPLLASQLVHVSPDDPMTLSIASAALVASAALGCWIPARRALQVDPVVALRHE